MTFFDYFDPFMGFGFGNEERNLHHFNDLERRLNELDRSNQMITETLERTFGKNANRKRKECSCGKDEPNLKDIQKKYPETEEEKVRIGNNKIDNKKETASVKNSEPSLFCDSHDFNNGDFNMIDPHFSIVDNWKNAERELEDMFKEKNFKLNNGVWEYFPFGKDKTWKDGNLQIKAKDGILNIAWKRALKNENGYESSESRSVSVNLPEDANWDTLSGNETDEGYLKITAKPKKEIKQDKSFDVAIKYKDNPKRFA